MKSSKRSSKRFFTSRFFHFLSSLLLILSFVACSGEDANVTDIPSDQEISETIQTQLEGAPDVSADSIEIRTTDGIVELTGTVDNLLAKQRATEITEAVIGVLSVINNLKVTADRPDKILLKDVTNALKTDPATEQWDISADVNNGMVTLTGNADSWQEKQLAGTIVSGVKGVTNIENNIQVTLNSTREDSAIETEVTTALQFDSRIRNNLIDIEVENDTVRLSGSVGSATEKRLATEKAFVAGVKNVEADNLEVEPEFNSQRFIDDTISSLSAEEIKDALHSTFSYDPRVPADSIDITIENERAILEGTVKNLNSKLAAGEDATHTTGINDVENNITVERKVVVKPETPTTDEAIKSRIRNSIMRSPYVDEVNITMNVKKGIVELNGSVNSEFEKNQISQIASDVKGVIGINNNLEIESQSS